MLTVKEKYSRIPKVERIRNMWHSVVQSDELCTVRKIEKTIPPKRKIIKKIPSEKIKSDVRELVTVGIPVEEIWNEFQTHFSSRNQFGAVIAWASPNLSRKRKS